MNKKGYIYCYTNLINNKQYIGSTIKEPNLRYNQHKYNSSHKNCPQYNYPLYQAFRKYGLENFSFEILEEVYCKEDDLRILEQEYINKYNSLSPYGYNQTLNTLHPLLDEKTQKKVSETKRNQAKRIAEITTDFQIIKIWRSIIDCSEQEGLNEKHLSACCRGERLSTDNRYFCWLDDNNNLIIPEYKRDPYKGEKGTTQIQSTSKKVIKLDDEGNVLSTYDTIALAARENDCDASGISKVCRNLRNKCGGYKWKYAE